MPDKGMPFPDSASPANWNVLREDLPVPVLVLRESALAANIRAMAEWCARNNLMLCPHGKTTMCPQIFQRQMAAGAWGITVATVSQALVCAQAGIRRILIANQVVGAGNLRSLAALMHANPELEVLCLVDSVTGVEYLARGAFKRRVGVLVEIGKTGWRTGVRSEEEARGVYESVQQHSAVLEFRGFEAFEGMAKNPAEASDFLVDAVSAAVRIAESSNLIFSAGGSSYLGPVANALRALPSSWTRVVRSGCYVTHDHGIYAQQQEAALSVDTSLPTFAPALELWACVQSMPDPGLAIVTFGKRDCAYDISLPIPLDLPGAGISAINDQHAYLRYPPETTLKLGSLLRFGISHPCTAFDKWRVIPLVDDSYNVIDLYRTAF